MRSLLWIWTFLVASCVSDVQVLESDGVDENPGPSLTLPGSGGGPSVREPSAASGGSSGDTSVPSGGSSNSSTGGRIGILWTRCEAALSDGLPGDSCVFEPPECRDNADCCIESVACRDGGLQLERSCASCDACDDDPDCPFGKSFCVAGSCKPCPAEEPCNDLWDRTTRNGCGWCVPPNQCSRDGDCPATERCYPGALCIPGCANDPSCCFGNLCASAGCTSPPTIDCALVGCDESRACRIVGAPVSCACVGSNWRCTDGTSNVCAPF
jgi:hypothetical protein